MIATDELAIELRPAIAAPNNDVDARVYALTIRPDRGWRRVTIDGVQISPESGVVEVWLSQGFGAGSPRRATAGDKITALAGAVADEFSPLNLWLLNLSAEHAVMVTLRVRSET